MVSNFSPFPPLSKKHDRSNRRFIELFLVNDEMNDSQIPSAKLYNDKLNVKEMSSFSGWKLLSLHPPIPAFLSLSLPASFVKTWCFQRYYFYLLGPFNRAAINPVDVEIILKCKCRNTGNEANPFCPTVHGALFLLHESHFLCCMSYGLSFARWRYASEKWNRGKQGPVG